MAKKAQLSCQSEAKADRGEGNNDAHLGPVWHRELRDLRNQIGLVPKLEAGNNHETEMSLLQVCEEKGKQPTREPWPKKSYAAVEVTPGVGQGEKNDWR